MGLKRQKPRKSKLSKKELERRKHQRLDSTDNWPLMLEDGSTLETVYEPKLGGYSLGLLPTEGKNESYTFSKPLPDGSH